ncbi:MAG: hypothetical protein ACFB51_06980, partial [Anaerolineae bacterium]
RSTVITRATGSIGLTTSLVGFGILIPVTAFAGLFGLGATIGSIAWDILMAQTFYRLGWQSGS